MLDKAAARKWPQTASQTTKGLPPTTFWRVAEDIPPSLQWSLMAVSVIMPLAAWWALSRFGTVESAFLPTPMAVAQALVRLYEQGHLITDTVASFLRVTIGFALAAAISIPLGIAMGAFASIRALFEPIISVIRYMPAAAFVPLLILYLGVGEAPKIVLILIGTIFFNVLMIMDAVKFVPKELIETTYTLGGQRLQAVARVISPYVAPKIVDAFRINIATSWNLVIVSELVAAESGLGKRILLAQKFMRTEEIFACLIVLGAIGFLLDLTLRLLLRLGFRWAL